MLLSGTLGVEAQFASLQDQLNKSISTTSTVVGAWQLYADELRQTRSTLDRCVPLTQQDADTSSMASVKDALHKTKSAEQTMRAQQRQFNATLTRAQQLMKEVKKMEKLDARPLKQEVELLERNWSACVKDLEARRSAFDEQLVLWEQVHAGSDEIMTWLDSSIEQLERVSDDVDSTTLRAHLQQYKVGETKWL